MSDPVTVSTTDPVDLAQLTDELNGASLSARLDDDGTTITCHDPEITETELQAAIDAHEPPPAPPTAEEHLASLQAQIDEITDLILEGGI